MARFPHIELPEIDFSEFPPIDLARLQEMFRDMVHEMFPDVEIPTFDVPTFEMPKFELPKFELPKFELPKFELPDMSDVELPTAEQVASFARDAAYVGVGLAAMTVERVQVLQAHLLEMLKDQLTKVREAAETAER